MQPPKVKFRVRDYLIFVLIISLTLSAKPRFQIQGVWFNYRFFEIGFYQEYSGKVHIFDVTVPDR